MSRGRWLLLIVVALILVAVPLVGSSGQAVVESDNVGGVNPDQGQWHLRGEAGVTSFYFGDPRDFPILGDWNCDGTQTPGMYRQDDGFVYLRNSNTQGVADIRFFFGNPGDIPLAGDFNGDGCDTVSIYRPSTSQVFIINKLGQNEGGLGQAETSYFFGNPGDKPFVGDFDGDKVETIGLHRESTGLVYFRNSHTQGVADNQFIFGDPGDRLVAGDWIGKGFDTPALFRPSNLTWYFRYTNTQGVADASFVWGEANWLPVAGMFGTLKPTPIPTSTTTTTTVPLPPGSFPPFQITGTGDSVVAASVPGNEIAVLRFTYLGESNFVVWALDSSFDNLDLLVNEIDAYRGARPVNTDSFTWDQPMRYLDVTASDSWTIDVEPLSMARELTDSLSGFTDDVIRTSRSGIADFTYGGSSNFIVWARSTDGDADLLVNEIGTYTGAHVIPSFTDFLEIEGIGSWTVDFR